MVKSGSKATEINVWCISIGWNKVADFHVVHRISVYDKRCMPCLYLTLSLQDVSIPDLIKQLDILGDNGVSWNGRYFLFKSCILYSSVSDICDYDCFLRYLLHYASVTCGLEDWEECPLPHIHSRKHMNEFGSLSKPLFFRARILSNSFINRQELSNSLWLSKRA